MAAKNRLITLFPGCFDYTLEPTTFKHVAFRKLNGSKELAGSKREGGPARTMEEDCGWCTAVLVRFPFTPESDNS